VISSLHMFGALLIGSATSTGVDDMFLLQTQSQRRAGPDVLTHVLAKAVEVVKPDDQDEGSVDMDTANLMKAAHHIGSENDPVFNTGIIDYEMANPHLCDDFTSQESPRCERYHKDLQAMTAASNSLNDEKSSGVKDVRVEDVTLLQSVANESFWSDSFFGPGCKPSVMESIFSDYRASLPELLKVARAFNFNNFYNEDQLQEFARLAYYNTKWPCKGDWSHEGQWFGEWCHMNQIRPYFWPADFNPPPAWFDPSTTEWGVWCPFLMNDYKIRWMDETLKEQCDERSKVNLLGSFKTFKIRTTKLHLPSDLGDSEGPFDGDADMTWKIWCDGPDGRIQYISSSSREHSMAPGDKVNIDQGWKTCRQGSMIHFKLVEVDTFSDDIGEHSLEPNYYELLMPGHRGHVSIDLKDPSWHWLDQAFKAVMEAIGGICLTDLLGPLGKGLKMAKRAVTTAKKIQKAGKTINSRKKRLDKAIKKLDNDDAEGFVDDVWNAQCIQAPKEPVFDVHFEFSDAQPGWQDFETCLREAKATAAYQAWKGHHSLKFR